MSTTPETCRPVNYDESRVPPYTLPNPLIAANGTPVTTPAQWESRRQEILDLFTTHVYGRSPPPPASVPCDLIATVPHALGGRATRKVLAIYPTGRRDGPRVDLLLHLPAARQSPAPLFLGLNFRGNQTIHTDPTIPVSSNWVHARPALDLEAQQTDSPDESRGTRTGRWCVESLMDHGYGLATAFYGDLEPDHLNGWKDGVRGALASEFPPDQPDSWGAISAWAWGLSRIVDCLVTDPGIDPARIAVMGHSRLGKTALWAAAQDRRIAMAISNNSGCGGAALSRRDFGETVARINLGFPHWFCGNFKRYNDNESALPVDQHELLALIAPRPLYVASATEDHWCDQRGEFLSALNAEPVYRLLGQPGLGVTAMPPPNHPVGGRIGYHIRTGTHNVEPYDWEQYVRFADRELK